MVLSGLYVLISHYFFCTSCKVDQSVCSNHKTIRICFACVIWEFNECHDLKDRSVVRENFMFVKHDVSFVYCILYEV